MDSKFHSGKTEAGKGQGRDREERCNTYASTNVSGTGPFSVKFREQGVKLEYGATPTTGTRPPRATSKPDRGTDQRKTPPVLQPCWAAMDMIHPVAPNDLERVKNGKGFQLVTLSGTRAMIIELNQNTNPALKDKRVRQAINYAINQVGIVEKINKGFGPALAR